MKACNGIARTVAGAFQVRSTSCGAPVPLKLITTVGLTEELLLMVNWPEADPVAGWIKLHCQSQCLAWVKCDREGGPRNRES